MMKTSRLARSALIGACYAALTLALPYFGYGAVQFRVSEAMCILPFFMPEAVLGLTAGCLAANLLGMSFGMTTPWDVLLGTLATLFSAYLTARIKKAWLAPLPAVVINAVMIGVMLTYLMTPGLETAPLYYNVLTVGVGQVAACYGLGLPLLYLLRGYLNRTGVSASNQ